MIIFGNAVCPHCNLETRFMHEEGEGTPFLLLGDELNTEKAWITSEQECDYCQGSYTVYIHQIERIISAFLNEKQQKKYENHHLSIQKVKNKEGIKKEKEGKLTQFHETFTTPFAEQPYHFNHSVKIGDKNWRIEKIYKKENQEKDVEKRLLSPTYDEYWYEVVNNRNKRKWLVVVDDEEDNAILMQEPPYLKENEIKVDVTENEFKNQILFEEKVGEQLHMTIYQYATGIRGILFNEWKDIELDVFEESPEKVLQVIQEYLTNEVEDEEFEEEIEY